MFIPGMNLVDLHGKIRLYHPVAERAGEMMHPVAEAHRSHDIEMLFSRRLHSPAECEQQRGEFPQVVDVEVRKCNMRHRVPRDVEHRRAVKRAGPTIEQQAYRAGRDPMRGRGAPVRRRDGP